MKKAVFIDRDGTIIEDCGHIAAVKDVIFIKGAFEALQKLQNFYELFIVTNQPGIAKGIITFDNAEKINNYILEALRKERINIKEIYMCPHKREDECRCIKPKPYFLKRAAKSYNIDLKKSFSVGDHPHDVELAHYVGGKGIYVLTGHGEKHINELAPNTTIMPDINAAADWIICKHSYLLPCSK